MNIVIYEGEQNLLQEHRDLTPFLILKLELEFSNFSKSSNTARRTRNWRTN